MWEKEAEVDRQRDRWPMSLLVSRVKMFNMLEENKPRDVIAALRTSKGDGGVSLLAEVSRNISANLWGPERSARSFAGI